MLRGAVIVSGPCLCGDPWCGSCFAQPEPCSVCGLLRPEDCEDCPPRDEEDEGFERPPHEDCACTDAELGAGLAGEPSFQAHTPAEAAELFGALEVANAWFLLWTTEANAGEQKEQETTHG